MDTRADRSSSHLRLASEGKGAGNGVLRRKLWARTPKLPWERGGGDN